MNGTVAITDPRWYGQLRDSVFDEVNFWKPSARQAFRAPEFSPFFFKLPKPHYAICGFGFFAQFTRLPIWLAWEVFGQANGCGSLEELEERIREHRERFRYEPGDRDSQIGCIQIVNPIWFPEDRWVDQPHDWPVHGQRPKRYDLDTGEGARVWSECLATAQALSPPRVRGFMTEDGERFGRPVQIRPRLGQGTFRIAVTEAYERACAITGEHSLPVLDAAHIKPFGRGGPHEVSNGLLLRADLHRLFDKGYLTVTPTFRVRVSSRLRDEYKNGRTYYPFEGASLRNPRREDQSPDPELLDWHGRHVFAA
jgi:putative restriction endonuclease